jgi:hypothetical protein
MRDIVERADEFGPGGVAVCFGERGRRGGAESSESPARLDMDSTVPTLIVISLFAALCAIVAFLLDQRFLAAIFAAQFAFSFIEAVRRSR